MAETSTTASTTAAEARSTAAEKAATTRKTNATKRSTAAKKAAGTRAANRGASARSTAARKTKATATRTATKAKDEIKSPVGRATEIAEKAVLVPVGAALIARDEVVSTFEDLRSSYGSRAKAKQELRRFERRGSNALKGIERDAKKTRTRVEKELKKVDKQLKGVVKDIETRTEPVMKNVEFVSARIENAYESGRTAATKATTIGPGAHRRPGIELPPQIAAPQFLPLPAPRLPFRGAASVFS